MVVPCQGPPWPVSADDIRDERYMWFDGLKLENVYSIVI
jgi:hypothetical protein